MNYSIKASLLLLSAILVSACGGGSSSSGSSSELSTPVTNARAVTTGIPAPGIPATRQGTEFLAEQCISIDRTNAPNNVIVFNTCSERIITRDLFPGGVFENLLYPIEPNSGLRFSESGTRTVQARIPACFSPYVPAGAPDIDQYSCLLP